MRIDITKVLLQDHFSICAIFSAPAGQGFAGELPVLSSHWLMYGFSPEYPSSLPISQTMDCCAAKVVKHGGSQATSKTEPALHLKKLLPAVAVA
jgi:hypothetical protein